MGEVDIYDGGSREQVGKLHYPDDPRPWTMGELLALDWKEFHAVVVTTGDKASAIIDGREIKVRMRELSEKEMVLLPKAWGWPDDLANC